MSSFSYNPFLEEDSQQQFTNSLSEFKSSEPNQVLQNDETQVKEILKSWLEKSNSSQISQEQQQVARFICECAASVLGELEEPFSTLVTVYKKLDLNAYNNVAHQTPMQYGLMLDWRLSLSLDQKRIGRLLDNSIQALFGISNDQAELTKHYEKALNTYVKAKTPEQYGEALSQFNMLSGNDDNNGIINHRIGLLYLYHHELFNPEYAKSFFIKAAENILSDVSEQWETQLFELMVEINREEYHETLYKDDLKKWLSSEAYFQAAVTSYILQDYKEAQKYIDLAIVNNDKFLEAKYLKAKIYARLENIEEVTKLLIEVIEKERLFAVKALFESDFWLNNAIKSMFSELQKQVFEEVETRLKKCYDILVSNSLVKGLLDEIKEDFSNESLLHVYATKDALSKKRTWTTTPVVFRPNQRVFGHTLRVNSIAFTQDARLMATASWKIIISDLSSGEELKTLIGHSVSEYVYSVAFSHNNKLLASASSDRTIKIWDVKSGQELKSLSGHTQSINSVHFNNSDTILASASSDGTIRLWDVAKGHLIKTFKADKNGVNTIAFSPDGKYIAAGGWAMTIAMWDVEQMKEVRKFVGHEYCVNGLSFSPDGKTLASASWDKTIKLWNVETGELENTLVGHHNGIESVKFNSDGQKLVSTSYNRNGKLCVVKLWDVGTGEEEETIAGDFYGVEFSPDGNTLALASRDKTIKLWGAPILTIEDYIQIETEALAIAQTNGCENLELEPESEDERRRRVNDRRQGGFWLGSGDRRRGNDRRNL